MSLELARSFHKQGYFVILADSLMFPVGRWSNTIAKYERMPRVRQNTMAYIDAITSLVTKYEITDLIPCCEESFYIAKYKHNWKCKVWTADIKFMDLLHNKETFASEFKGQLAIPETISLDKFSQWENSSQYVFKPKYSRFAGKIYLNSSITNETISYAENWIAQKKVEGTEICVYSIWDEGKLKGYASYEPLFRAGKGAGTFFKRIEHERLKEKVKRFGEFYKYTGQLSFDVIVTNEISWFIECNPRGTSGAHLLNDVLANCFFNEGETFTKDKKDYMLSSLILFAHPLGFLQKRVRQAKGVIFRFYDPLPSVLQLLSVLEIIFIKFSEGIDLLKATTFDIEWNGHEG